MKNPIARIYSIYSVVMFGITMVIFMLPQLILAQNRRWHIWALKINHQWAKAIFTLLLIKIQIVKKYHPDENKNYIICANHFSFLDIPAMGLVPIPFKFIGKSSLNKLPLFGYMFRKIHVPVDRGKINSRVMSLKQAIREINEGYNMMFFPEGGIVTTSPPKMVPFWDGAFRLSVKYQLPVLPVVIHDNHKILPDDGKFLMFNHKLRMTILEPVFPQNNDETEIDNIKDLVFEKVQKELDENN